MKGHEALPELVRRTGVSAVFSMLGHTNVTWLGHGAQQGMFRLIKTRHEETAGHAAYGYSRATGRIGIFSVTRGPGFANAINSLTVAMKSHIPVMLIVAESPSTRTRTTQNVNQREHAAAIGVGFHHVEHIEDLEACFRAAYCQAFWNGCPQVLSIGDGVLEGTVELSDEPMPDPHPADRPDPDAVRILVDALAASKRPLLIAGQGAVLSECHDELVELAGLVGARVANALGANCFFAGHPHDLGLCGSWSPEPARACLAQSDVVVAFGASLNERTLAEGTIFGGAKLFQCEIDSDVPFAASSTEYGLLGDARETARAIIAEWLRRGLDRRDVVGTTPSASEIRAAVLRDAGSNDPANGLDLRLVYDEMDRRLPPDRIVITDSGSSLGTLPNLVSAPDARHWIVGRSYGSVGSGVGIALGAAVAQPSKHVVAFIGDGGFMMAVQAVDSFRIHGIHNVTLAIMNNRSYGSEEKPLEKVGLPRDICRQDLPDIPLLAAAYGARGVVVHDERELFELDVVSETFQLIDFRTDPDVLGRSVVS